MTIRVRHPAVKLAQFRSARDRRRLAERGIRGIPGMHDLGTKRAQGLGGLIVRSRWRGRLVVCAPQVPRRGVSASAGAGQPYPILRTDRRPCARMMLYITHAPRLTVPGRHSSIRNERHCVGFRRRAFVAGCQHAGGRHGK